MLVRLWRKGNYPALLVGMWIGAAPMENYMAVPQKIKMEQSYEPAILLLSVCVCVCYIYIYKENQNTNMKGYMYR